MKKFSKNRNSRRNEGRGERNQMHSAVCAVCAKRCEVPFRPTGDKPIYCSFCFEKEGGTPSRRRDTSGRREKELRKMFPAQCDNCGKRCEVPFRPTGDKPIYCSFCFEKVEEDKDDFKKHRKEKNEITKSDISMLGDQLISINRKLEKLLLFLIPEEEKVISVKKDADTKKEKKTSLDKPKIEKKKIKKAVKKITEKKK